MATRLLLGVRAPLLLAATAAATTIGCAIDDDLPAFADDLATTTSPIIGGTRSLGVEATVLLAGFPPDRSILHACTAVVVAPTVLLTSAHCVDEPNHPDYLYGVFTGDDAAPYPTLADLEPQLKTVKSVHPHPQYSPDLPFYADIAVVIMNAPLPNAPLPMQTTPIDATISGKPARIVGYGQTVYGQYNSTRYEAMTTVGAIENDTVVVGDSTRRSCLGDSGGPAIVDGKVIGIDSYGPVGCDGPAHYRRVDTFMPFISPYVPAAGTDPDPDPQPDSDMDDGDSGGCSVARSRAAGPGRDRDDSASLWPLLVLVLCFARSRRRR